MAKDISKKEQEQAKRCAYCFGHGLSRYWMTKGYRWVHKEPPRAMSDVIPCDRCNRPTP